MSHKIPQVECPENSTRKMDSTSSCFQSKNFRNRAPERFFFFFLMEQHSFLSLTQSHKSNRLNIFWRRMDSVSFCCFQSKNFRSRAPEKIYFKKMEQYFFLSLTQSHKSNRLNTFWIRMESVSSCFCKKKKQAELLNKFLEIFGSISPCMSHKIP